MTPEQQAMQLLIDRKTAFKKDIADTIKQKLTDFSLETGIICYVNLEAELRDRKEGDRVIGQAYEVDIYEMEFK